ncbi:hypothetical protein Tco_0985575 [Tanacetum coccineum]
MIDSLFENSDYTQIGIPPNSPLEQLLNDFMNPPDVLEMDDTESDDESINTPLVSPFLDSDDELVLEDIGEFIVSDMADVVMGRPYSAVTQLEYDCVKGMISFTRIFDTYIFMPHTIPRLRNFKWSKVPPN